VHSKDHLQQSQSMIYDQQCQNIINCIWSCILDSDVIVKSILIEKDKQWYGKLVLDHLILLNSEKIILENISLLELFIPFIFELLSCHSSHMLKPEKWINTMEIYQTVSESHLLLLLKDQFVIVMIRV
jgi:hypothetical protein